MTINQYKALLESLDIKLDEFEGGTIDADVADIKAELLKRYYKTALKVSGHTNCNCSLEILTDKIRAFIFVKTVRPYKEGDFGVIHYRRACDDDMDDVFFEYPLSHRHRIEVFCKPEEVVAKCEEILNSECDVIVGPDEYKGWMEFKKWEDTIEPPIGEEGIQELLNQLSSNFVDRSGDI